MGDVSGDERRVCRCRVWSADCSWSKVSLQKTIGGGNRYDTGSQKHMACSGIAGIGVVWCSTPNTRRAHLRDGGGGQKEGSYHVYNVTHHP